MRIYFYDLKDPYISGSSGHSIFGRNCATNSHVSDGGSTGAAGAFAPAGFQQQVHCTRPDEELS